MATKSGDATSFLGAGCNFDKWGLTNLQYNRIETVLVGFFVAFQQLLRNEV
jgi:hypothetical protein